MPGKKKRSVYRKTKKGYQFTGVQRHSNTAETQENVQGNIQGNEGESSSLPSRSQPSTSSEDQPLSASRIKMKRRIVSSSSSDSSDCEIEDSVEGYRLVNIGKLASTLDETHVCDGGKIISNIDYVT